MIKNTKYLFKMTKGILDLKKNRSESYLAHFFEEESGIFLKLGQYLGTKENSREHFEKISLKPKPKNQIDVGEIKKIFEEKFQQNFDDIFESISEEAKCASIGQVHEAVLKDGTEVVLKCQYPAIKEEIQNQLNLLGLAPKMLKMTPLKKWGVNTSTYIDWINKTIDQELNYLQEVNNQKKFQSYFEQFPNVEFSQILDKFCHEEIFVQTKLDGRSFLEFQKSSTQQEKIELANLLAENFIYQVLKTGFIQADTNIGNYLVDKRPKVTLQMIDFGNCFQFSNEFRLSLLKIFHEIIFENNIDLYPYLVSLGFDSTKLNHFYEQIPLLVKTLFEPIHSDHPFDFSKWSLDKELELILGENKWWFRSAGSTDFFTLMKAFSGVKNLIARLNININWHLRIKRILLENLAEIEKFDLKNDINQNSPLKMSSISKSIVITVIENNEEKVRVSLPINAIYELNEYIDPPIIEKLKKRNLDISNIINEAIKNGCRPQILFELNEENKNFQVELK